VPLAYHRAMVSLGINFEREIREQPDVWERIARSDAAAELAAGLDGEIILIGSGSSLFAAQLGAIALRRRGIGAHALAASEARGDNRAYQQRTIVALSQSGRSVDVLSALDVLHPKRTIALTNSIASPLAERADLTIDVLAGPEDAIPASKSVSSTIAILLSTASLIGGDRTRDPEMLIHTAENIRTWLDGSGVEAVVRAAVAIAARHDVMVLGTDYGAPIAREAALKFKEATYLHAEGFEAGEFRHGSAAMVDASSVVLGILDRDAIDIVGRPLREARKTGALRYAIGTTTVDGVMQLGPIVDDSYNTLAWLVTVQLLALHVARARGIDSDRPRGLTKALVAE
jgi:glutamine---fructose-6-phosphate transaminase (isomerizing)